MNDRQPLVSICIPAFNRSRDIWRALESCINQTYQNLEIVVSDNASTDNTKEVVLDYTKRDSRINYYRNEVNIGSGRNFLVSAKRATGRFIQVLGDDDWLSKNYIEECVKIMDSDPSLAAVMTNVVALEAKGDNQFSFIDQDLMEYKKYSADWFLSNFYKHPHVGGKGFISFMRREDFINSLSKEINRSTSSLNRGKFSEVIDGVLFPGVLSRYKSFIITDKAAYLKTISGSNVGLQGDFLKNPAGMIDYFLGLRRAYEAVFEDYRELKPYIKRIRFFFGLNMVVKSLYFLLSGKLSFSEFPTYFKKLFSHFFRGYSFLEKSLIFAAILPAILFRLVKRFLSFFIREPTFSTNANYFLTDDFRFKI